jgi:hypothetical protein
MIADAMPLPPDDEKIPSEESAAEATGARDEADEQIPENGEARLADEEPFVPRVNGSTDPFAPPAEPCECYCLHCQRTFMSTGIWFQRVIGDPYLDGFWMCPTPNCSGAGFTFDIFPTDPTHPANAGWHDCGEDEDYEEEDGGDGAGLEPVEADGDWDPDEAKYRQLDEMMGPAEDDMLEGDEWKHGLEPGERPPSSNSGQRERDEEEAAYDQPDERPRVLDWTDRRSREEADGGGQFSEDDIPF